MTTKLNTPNLDLTQLIEGLRREDDRNMHLTNRFQMAHVDFRTALFLLFPFDDSRRRIHPEGNRVLLFFRQLLVFCHCLPKSE